jgi:hypothetical protein
MDIQSPLSTSEWTSLREVARGPFQEDIPGADAARLLHLRLIYKLLGGLRITSAGKAKLLSVR